MNATFTVSFALGPLISSKQGPVADVGFDRPQRVHMRQSELDGACGQHALLMATVGMGLWTRRELLMKRRDQRSEIGRLWTLLAERHFLGTRAEHLSEALNVLRDSVGHRVMEGSSGGVASFAVRTVLSGRFTLLRIQGPASSLDHWVLAVAVEARREGRGHRPVSLLALDSNHEAPKVGIHNARLSLPRKDRRWAEMQTISGTVRTIAYHSALAMWRRS